MAIFGKGNSSGSTDAGSTPESKKPKEFMLFRPRQRRDAATSASSNAPLMGAGAVPAYRRPDPLQIYLIKTAAKNKDLEAALRAQGIKTTPYEFTRKMFFSSIILAVVIGAALVPLALLIFNGNPAGVVIAVLVAVLAQSMSFKQFIRYPITRSAVVGKEIERDILYAARDLVISMRSGMPLFNAMAAVSTGYGATSKEFAKIVELVSLGTPMEQAIDNVSSRSQSTTFKRVMLQASVSLKAGSDVVSALQGVVDEVMQERVIELRRYGQRLNAMAMFYMLFGVIFPSMGIAVAAIITMFIQLFTVNRQFLIMAAFGIFFLQLVFLFLMRSSRPAFAM